MKLSTLCSPSSSAENLSSSSSVASWIVGSFFMRKKKSSPYVWSVFTRNVPSAGRRSHPQGYHLTKRRVGRQHLESPSSRSVRSSAPSRTTAPGKSVVNFGFTTLVDFVSGCRPSHFHSFVIVHCDELPEPIHYTDATVFQQTCDNLPNRTVAIFLLILSGASTS